MSVEQQRVPDSALRTYMVETFNSLRKSEGIGRDNHRPMAMSQIRNILCVRLNIPIDSEEIESYEKRLDVVYEDTLFASEEDHLCFGSLDYAIRILC